jgi:hypothetical protein
VYQGVAQWLDIDSRNINLIVEIDRRYRIWTLTYHNWNFQRSNFEDRSDPFITKDKNIFMIIQNNIYLKRKRF